MVSVVLLEIGSRICRRRKQLGITQEQLAERMNVSVQMISNLERGNKAIRIDNLINLCQILKVSTDYILLGQVETDSFTEMKYKLAEKDVSLIEALVERLAE